MASLTILVIGNEGLTVAHVQTMVPRLDLKVHGAVTNGKANSR
jgi:hypothetical protein